MTGMLKMLTNAEVKRRSSKTKFTLMLTCRFRVTSANEKETNYTYNVNSYSRSWLTLEVDHVTSHPNKSWQTNSNFLANVDLT